ncbi:hypothetical protein CDZ97_10045 [Mameliella alba]|uniref:hypothetical protein n=1 Tax=Mameliella alba TaxID=561184 RepID=UPI000B53808B|nr:hypothetical protein [Mameliella alba]OWV65183.1 hypothetical protein CDZ97_10045 [Mameliella alba]
MHHEPLLIPLLFETPGGSVAFADRRENFGPVVGAMQEGRTEASIYRFIEAVFELQSGSAETEAAAPMWRDNARTIALEFGSAEPPLPMTCAALSDAKMPTLVVQGAMTFPAFSIMSEKLVHCLPKATMDGVDHDGPYRRQDDLAKMISGFLAVVGTK